MDRREFMAGTAAGVLAAALTRSAIGGVSVMSDEAIEARIKEIIPRLTLEQKVELMSGQMRKMLLRIMGTERRYTGYTLGDDALGIPQLKCLDGPRGVGLLYKTTCFPVGMARGATWDPELEQRVGAVMGYETRALGANMLLAPCINLVWHPRWGRAQETYGEDPHLLGLMGAAFTKGLQQHVMACVKHYAVNNIEDTRMDVDAIVDERTLREVFIPHFKKCVDAGAASLMSSYNHVNGPKAGQNHHLMRDILKDEWGFDGFVVSDWGTAMDDTVEAANAGMDLEMPTGKFYGAKLTAAVRDGRVPESALDEAVARMTRQLLRFVGPDFEAGYDAGKIASPEHAALAREAAEKSLTLLKNDGNVLPLDPSQTKTLAVIGALAAENNLGDHGSSIVTPPYTVSILAGLQARAGVKVVHYKGTNPDAAAKIAGGADAVVVVAGLNYEDEGEGHDRKGLDLPERQTRMIEAAAGANPKTAVVLVGGSAITMDPWLEAVPAVLMAWYPGMEGGAAVANALFGDVNPSGKLPLVFPRSEDQLPAFENKALRVEYKGLHGYRRLDRSGERPLFPFGFGLSYTTFQYAGLRVEKAKGGVMAKVDVTNTGARPGAEIAQFYVGYPGSKVDRPDKDLKGFARVVLAPGETRTVAVEIASADLAFYNVDRGGWEVEDIEYVVLAGPSSDLGGLLSAKFRL